MNQTKVNGMNNTSFAPTRRQVLGFGLALAGAAAVNVVPGFRMLARRRRPCRSPPRRSPIIFPRSKSMTGEFVQFGPKGEQTGGKFYLERPGKIRFNYDGVVEFPGHFRRQVGGHPATRR